MSTVNPFSDYQFVVKWDGEYVAAVTHVSGLTRPEEHAHAAGRPVGPRRIPGEADYGPVRLERGIVTDATFDRWASMEWELPETSALGEESTMADFRKPMQIEVYDEAGGLALRYNLHDCWPSDYTALPELDSEANTIALESLTIQHEGWETDPSVSPAASD